MVSSAKVWDPPHAGLTQPHLREQRLDPCLTPVCHSSTAAKDTALHQSRQLSPLSSPPPSLVTLSGHHPVQQPPVSLYAVNRTDPLNKPAHSLGVVSQSEEEEEENTEQLNMKGKRLGYRIETTLDDKLEDMDDGPKNAKITLSFPLGAAPLPSSMTSPDRCQSSSSSSPSPQRRRLSSKSSDRGSLWKLDATMDVKHRPFKPARHDRSPSSSPSSSSSSMAPFIRKDLKSPPPLKCSKLSPESQIHKSPPRASSGTLGGCFSGDGWDERHRMTNGTASPSQTAQILFSLGTSAYQRGVDADRREKLTGRPAGKTGSPHRPSLHPPTLHLPPPLPPPPPPPSEGLTAPPHSSSYPPSDSMKPELICGVCHRLFSSASSLTVHMRLHRGSRALSCRYCGKAFIHSKRLQSHEASCRMPGLGPPSLTVQPKEEPLEEGEVRVEGGVIVGQTDISKGRPGKKVRNLLARIQAGDAAASELLAGDENHFVKVVDGNVIYFCSVCERSYMTLSSLKRHSNVHSWRRKYPCHYCDKVFALAEYRTKHEVWHTGERRYQCIFCWDAFATYYNLKTHQKTIHGINPSLISSEKTANGGYKQRANALKLYRLLPMRSQKRPYKTYSDSLHNGLLLPPADTPSLSLPGLGCALGPGDLQSIIAGAPPQSLKPDPDAFPDGFPISLAAGHTDVSELALEPQVRTHKSESLELEQERGSFKVSNSNKLKTFKVDRGTETSMPSVITYGHTKPSVIVHGAAVSSSVIVHSNQVTSGSEKSPVTSPSPETSSSQILGKGSPKKNKKQKDNTDNHRKRSRDSSDAFDQGSKSRLDTETGKAFHKSRKSHNKGAISKVISASGGSQAKESGPLCQITVRIGEEAIVKRSISETDLKRDKSLSPPKIKRSETSSVKEPRQTHSHHHHHKHHSLSRASLEGDRREKAGDDEEDQEEMEEQEVRNKRPKSPDQVREYFFRKGVREQDSDNDIEDNLWRPYYSYKPKKKAQAHLQRVKNWQRKLKYKRSIRLKRRAERLKRLLNKQTEKSQDEGEDRTTEEAEKLSKLNKESEEEIKKCNLSSSLKEKKQDVEEQVQEACHKVSTPPIPAPKPPLSTSVAPTGIKRRPWTNGNAAECGTCGRWFSSPRKRDKHELSHLLEFVCLFCRATFPSREKLEDHQKAQHPKPTEAPSVATKCGEQVTGIGIKSVPELSKFGEDKEGQLGLGGSSFSPSRLSRRALSRHTCPQCHKVCKTSSALSRHMRRHDLSSSPEREREDNNLETTPSKAIAEPLCTDPGTDKGQTPNSLSVSVINYSPAELPSNGDCLTSQQHDEHLSEPKDKFLKPETSEDPELTQPALISPEIAPVQQTEDPPLESQINLTPIKPDVPPPAPSSLQSVLVMNGPDCLDYRTAIKKSLDGQIHRIASPLHFVTSPNTSPNVPMTSQTRITTPAPPVSMTTAANSEGGFTRRDGVIIDRERQSVSGTILHTGYKEPPQLQNLRVHSLSRSPSPNEAQDLTMSSILAREREIERQRVAEEELERQREQKRNMEIEQERISRVAHPSQEQTSLIVPKEEPLSPVASPQHMSTPTTINGACSRRQTPKSPCRPPSTTGLMAQASRQVHPSSQALDRLTLPTGATDRPSAHALLLPRASQQPEPDHQDTFFARDSQQGDTTPADYPAQDYPLPLIVPDSYRSVKKQEDNLLMSTYPPGALPFGPLGKVIVPDRGDLGKLPFYPDPYQLLYGPQLLAYPYNLAALPVTLNMMAPGGDKVEPLPFLPTIFNYAATAGPYMGAAPHPLVANPGLYRSSGSGKKQRDGSGSKQ
ncbi:uncharacterized protein zbtb4 [Cyprinodon tularosa]|uniref:uncharacterized protein zbtb4 n=1 Tax=Cyprinodon tularosa TaxID=77115 RepID=UPI0018E200B3|nr:uncharacterized protein zbtb4 [Cyprinodon tularosa]XP_038140889.1 uncharacterized protein zbtb4 [Cyprinodon tularosa]XP_038140890.1 uncharacterized protein zbtb4 [Cyprinodon tularosa]XP_038140891.1 uncharacterized protein zbtb4 [Cyprinodon tularosa]